MIIGMQFDTALCTSSLTELYWTSWSIVVGCSWLLVMIGLHIELKPRPALWQSSPLPISHSCSTEHTYSWIVSFSRALWCVNKCSMRTALIDASGTKCRCSGKSLTWVLVILICIYTLGHKKRATLFGIITPMFRGGFFHFLHQWKQEKILYQELQNLQLYHNCVSTLPEKIEKHTTAHFETTVSVF